jgi:hypothetical protein
MLLTFVGVLTTLRRHPDTRELFSMRTAAEHSVREHLESSDEGDEPWHQAMVGAEGGTTVKLFAERSPSPSLFYDFLAGR